MPGHYRASLDSNIGATASPAASLRLFDQIVPFGVARHRAAIRPGGAGAGPGRVRRCGGSRPVRVGSRREQRGWESTVVVTAAESHRRYRHPGPPLARRAMRAGGYGHGPDIRFSVSSWSTTEDDIHQSVAAIRAAINAARTG